MWELCIISCIFLAYYTIFDIFLVTSMGFPLSSGVRSDACRRFVEHSSTFPLNYKKYRKKIY